MSLVSAWGITPISRRTASASVETSWPLMIGSAAGDRNERGHHADQRALARAIRPQQSKDLSIGDLEGDALDRLEIAIPLDDLFNGNGGRRLTSLTGCTGRGLHRFTSLLLGR